MIHANSKHKIAGIQLICSLVFRQANAVPIMTGTAAAESVLGRVAKSHAFTEFVFTILLVKEIPTYSKSEYPSIDRVVRCQEIISVSLSGVDVTHHDKETGMLDECISIDIDYRIIAYLYVLVTISLDNILSHIWRIVGCSIAREISGICT